jgi:hypothetical protein
VGTNLLLTTTVQWTPFCNLLITKKGKQPVVGHVNDAANQVVGSVNDNANQVVGDVNDTTDHTIMNITAYIPVYEFIKFCFRKISNRWPVVSGVSDIVDQGNPKYDWLLLPLRDRLTIFSTIGFFHESIPIGSLIAYGCEFAEKFANMC